MVFVINDLKYDTCKMERVSDKVIFQIKIHTLGDDYYLNKEAILYISNKGRWLVTYYRRCEVYAEPISEEEAKDLLKQYDLDTYESRFGELEEA